MNISSNASNIGVAQNSSNIKTDFREKISQEDAKGIKEQLAQRANEMAFNSTAIQNTVAYESFQGFLKDVGYDGKPIAELSQAEATELVSEDGFFGVSKTSQRIADFVINGASGDEDRMRAGRSGMIEGFKQAQDMWGGELPSISQETMQKAIEMVDKAMHEQGFSILNEEV